GPLTALSAWAAVRLTRARWLLVPVVGLGLVWAMWAADRPDEQWIAVFDPPFAATLGPLSYEEPHEPFSFSAEGNIVKTDGLDFDEFNYPRAPVWTLETWRAIYMLGVALLAVVLTALGGGLWDAARAFGRAGRLPPLAAVYGVGGLIFVV